MATVESFQEAYPECAIAVYIHESRVNEITWLVARLLLETKGFDAVLTTMKGAVMDKHQEVTHSGIDATILLQQMDSQQFRNYLAAKLGMM